MRGITDDKLKKRILEILLKDTLIKSSRGYSYTFTAIYLCCREGGIGRKLVDDVYKEVGLLYGVATNRVIRSIKYSLSKSQLGKTFTEVLQTVVLMLENNIK